MSFKNRELCVSVCPCAVVLGACACGGGAERIVYDIVREGVLNPVL